MLWQANISDSKRIGLIRYCISSHYREIRYQINMKNMPNQMKSTLFMASLEPESKFMKTFLPSMIFKVLMEKLRVRTYFEGYTLVDNV